MENSYGRKEKLKSKKLIDQLFAEGKSVTSFPIKLIYLETRLPAPIKIQTGVAVPKKNFGSAVKRNRIKRLLREAYRINKPVLSDNSELAFTFLLLYMGKEMPDYHRVDKNIKVIFEKFSLRYT